MKNLLFSLSILVVILLSGCEKYTIEGIPVCLDDELYPASRLCSDQKASLTSFMFQGEKVFILSGGNCIADGSTPVLTIDCDTVCVLGGFAGNTMCNGEVFYQTATDEELIWEE